MEAWMESLIRLQIEPLPEGGFVATSPDVEGLVAQGRTIVETIEIARDVARRIAESCIEHGDPLPKAFRKQVTESTSIDIAVAIP